MEKVLRASKIGFPCSRNLFYAVNGYEAQTSAKSQRIFDVGTYLEPLVVEWLRADGWTVEYNPGSLDAQLEVTIPIENGSLAGHPDCFISKGDITDCLADIKTMNDRSFTQWKRAGTLASKPQYVDQLHVYAMGCIRTGRNIKRLAVVGVNKNNSDWHIDFFDFDFYKAADLQDRASAVFSLTEPPTEDSPREAWCCNYCEFAHLCELKGTFRSKIEDTSPELSGVDDSGLALLNLQQARVLAREARSMEAEAKSALLAQSKATGTSTFKGSGLTCTISERTSSRFDTAAFKKAHPDLASQYTTESTATYFDIKED
ncbi:MAG: hypothetical protein IJS28_07095 [Synergistaceae bacterium]|nr:hypothetical protein [Synergistaceae bacterium]